MSYEALKSRLHGQSKKWVITGVSGFIASNILETLLKLNQQVVGLDNFFSGHRRNLDQVKERVSAAQWAGFRFVEGDIRDIKTCNEICAGADIVLHQAALGSVPMSLDRPLDCNAINVTGFINMLEAARQQMVRRFVFASSCAVYGDDPTLPKTEGIIGRSISPYATSKYMNELYADVFGTCYGMQTVGLRYFNVFGPRQDPAGHYAAVIPRWIASLLAGQTVGINGDGETSRDFCYVANIVQANLLAATVEKLEGNHQVFNIGTGVRTTLNQLFYTIRDCLLEGQPGASDLKPKYGPFREGDIRHSEADISKARLQLGFEPTHDLKAGLIEAREWYRKNL